MPLEGAVFVGNKIENDFCDLIFISHVVEQVLLDRSTMVLPLDEVSKYFISEKNRTKSKRFEVSFLSDPTLKGNG